MELFILTSTKDRSAAAITSASDTTALVGPDDFPQLVLGTTEPLTTKFLSAASTYETWADDPTYTVTASLGALSADGLSVFAEGTLSTVITDGKSGELDLTTAALVDAVRLAICNPRQTAVLMTLQITVTDPDGNRTVPAQLPVQVNCRVPSFTPSQTDIASRRFPTAAEVAAAYLAQTGGTVRGQLIASLNPLVANLDLTGVGPAIVIGTDAGTFNEYRVNSYAGSAPQFAGRGANGTSTAPTATTSGQTLVRMTGNGYGATGYVAGSIVGIFANQNFTDSAAGTIYKVQLVPNNSVTRQDVLSVSPSAYTIHNGNAPASAAASGVAGTIAWDTGFIYVCTATNTWKRAALSTW